jgi:hypothetical protein
MNGLERYDALRGDPRLQQLLRKKPGSRDGSLSPSPLATDPPAARAACGGRSATASKLGPVGQTTYDGCESTAASCRLRASIDARKRWMNLAAIVRRLEQGGFTHDQAVSVSEVFQNEIVDKIATKECVDLVLRRDVPPLENRITGFQHVVHVVGWHSRLADRDDHLWDRRLGSAAFIAQTGCPRRSVSARTSP